MSRFYFRLAVIPIALFTLVMIAIHAQLYDDHELRELLLPEGCPAPCFMGIRPGVTTMDETMKLLRSSKWVEMGHWEPTIDKETSEVRLGFNGSQPKVIDDSLPLILIFQNTAPQKINRVLFNFQDSVRLGDIYLVLGKPTRFNRNSFLTPAMGYGQYYLEVSHIYDAKMIAFATSMSCPISLNQLLNHSRIFVDYNTAIRANRKIDFRTILSYPDCG